MRRNEIEAKTGQKLLWKQSRHSLGEEVEIVGYGYTENRWERDPEKRYRRNHRGTATLVRREGGQLKLALSKDLFDKTLAESQAEAAAERAKQEAERRRQEVDCQRRIAPAQRLVALLGVGHVSDYDGHYSRAGTITLRPEDVPVALERLREAGLV